MSPLEKAMGPIVETRRKWIRAHGAISKQAVNLTPEVEGLLEDATRSGYMGDRIRHEFETIYGRDIRKCFDKILGMRINWDAEHIHISN